MKHLSIDADDFDCFSAVADELSSYFWIADSQSGYMQSGELELSESEWSRILETSTVEVVIGETVERIWQRGTFPDLVKLLRLDEWTTLTGFKCDPCDLQQVVMDYATCRADDRLLIGFLERHAGIHALYPADWWEVITDNTLLLGKLGVHHLRALHDAPILPLGSSPPTPSSPW